MTKVVVTGGFGFLGWHVMCCLDSRSDFSGFAAGRKHFADSTGFCELLRDTDVVIHLAGVNRGTDHEVMSGNCDAARALVSALRKTGGRPTVVYASSIHIDMDNNYGAAKRKAGQIISEWAEAAGARFVSLVLPHVFGECARPFYNSVVATFCHQLAEGNKPVIEDDGELQLLHAQAASDLIIRHVLDGSDGEIRPAGTRLRVSQLLGRLQNFDDLYKRQGIVPDVRDSLERDLFNTYRSYLYPARYPFQLTRNADSRGHLVEVVKNDNGGQAFFSSTKPGITRGNHYHRRKIERFIVIQGQAEIAIRRIFDDTVERFHVDGDRPVFVDMPTLHTHNITNTGDSDLLTLFWANEIFDPNAPDTVAAQVQGNQSI